MKVPIDNMTFAESEYHRGNKIWNAQTLYNFAKAKEYPVRDMPLWNIDLTVEPFECNQLHSFIFQCKRVRDCSLDYPIILDEVGQIADGYHRLCKAILEGRKTIKAIRLLEMPAPEEEASYLDMAEGFFSQMWRPTVAAPAPGGSEAGGTGLRRPAALHPHAHADGDDRRRPRLRVRRPVHPGSRRLRPAGGRELGRMPFGG